MSKKERVSLAEIIVVLVIFGLGVFMGMYYEYTFSEDSFDGDKAIQKLESRMELYNELYGTDEKKFRSILNFINVPTAYWKEDLSIKESIDMYYSSKPVSEMIIRKELREICR